MATIKCEKCGKTMDEGQFYTYKDGRKTELCKKCLTMHVDANDDSTFLWLLEKYSSNLSLVANNLLYSFLNSAFCNLLGTNFLADSLVSYAS